MVVHIVFLCQQLPSIGTHLFATQALEVVSLHNPFAFTPALQQLVTIIFGWLPTGWEPYFISKFVSCQKTCTSLSKHVNQVQPSCCQEWPVRGKQKTKTKNWVWRQQTSHIVPHTKPGYSGMLLYLMEASLLYHGWWLTTDTRLILHDYFNLHYYVFKVIGHYILWSIQGKSFKFMEFVVKSYWNNIFQWHIS